MNLDLVQHPGKKKQVHSIGKNLMEDKMRKHLGEKGFRVGSAAGFLELTPEEEANI